MKTSVNRVSLWLLLTPLLVTGCNPPAPSTEPGQVTTEISRTHGDDHSHHHDHDHPHDHSHPAVKSGHGGRMIPIGHTHHGSGATHYYAEIMQPADGKITMFITKTEAQGTPQPIRIDTEEIVGYAAPLDRRAGLATELVFQTTENSGRSMWSASIPESLKYGSDLSVVIPKITLDDEWLNFSFQTASPTTRNLSEDTTVEESE